ncbi:MAG: ATPase [Ardenticatenia bacterium]|nr:MAG: ATPase [Ardenticatenia bacterium]
MADIMYLVDQLEALLERGYRVPFTTNAVIDEDEFLNILDKMRVSIPRELHEAQRLMQERDRVLEEARKEAERIIAEARLKAQQLVAEEEIVRQAQAQAEQILEAARAEAEEIKRGADEYAVSVLQDLDAYLQRFSRQVQNGLAQLQEKHR